LGQGSRARLRGPVANPYARLHADLWTTAFGR
jgi:hypothetical protein